MTAKNNTNRTTAPVAVNSDSVAPYGLHGWGKEDESRPMIGKSRLNKLDSGEAVFMPKALFMNERHKIAAAIGCPVEIVGAGPHGQVKVKAQITISTADIVRLSQGGIE